MSLPPALLARLAQRGLVNKQKTQKENEPPRSMPAADNEEVIAEDYDEMDTETGLNNSEEYQYPSQYDFDHDVRKPTEDNYWLTQMKARMGEAGSSAGYKYCPNKYNIWHKCTLYCVNRWGEGKKPTPEYIKRYKRLIRKYPLPKGWVEKFDPGCGCYFFACESDNVVSWLPPTHPKSQVTKCAAQVRRQMEESTGEAGSDEEQNTDSEGESETKRHHREVDEIINSSLKPKSPRPQLDAYDFPTLQEVVQSPTVSLPKKQKSRDLDRTLSRQRDRDRDRGRDRSERSNRDRDRGGRGRHYRDEPDYDPMDPSSYSDTPRGKWSDGLPTGGEDRKKKSTDESSGRREKSSRHSDYSDEGDDY